MMTAQRMKLFALVVGCLVSGSLLAATSRHRYEAANASVNGGDGYKTADNTNATLAWGESYIMMSYMVMYRATGERLYLDRLADHADHVLATRDDLAGTTEFDGQSSACWRNTKYQPNSEAYCYVVHSGMLTFPMADFAAAVYATPTLWELPTYDGTTYKEKADLFVQRVEETVACHDFQWQNGPGAGQGHYVFDPTASFLTYAGQEMPLNQQNAMGRTLVMLHLATGKGEYLEKATALAKRFQAQLKLESDCYVWNYWGGAYVAPGEDISHAAINVDFARLCGEHGIVFSAVDLKRLANTLFKKICKDSETLYDKVGGSGAANGSSYKPQIARWLHLTPYRPATYTIVRNIYDGYETATGSGSVVLGFALLAAYEPVVRPHYFYYVDWAQNGDFNQATAQNANILTVPPDPQQRAMVPVTYASTVPVSVQQWDDVVYHEVGRWASTGGTWKTLWLPYVPEHWHPYWQGGALFQFTESPFAGLKVKVAEELAPPVVETADLAPATVGETWEAELSVTGPGPYVWTLVEGPPGMAVSWDTGKLKWPSVPGPGGGVGVTVRVDNDYGFDEVKWTLVVEEPWVVEEGVIEPMADVVEAPDAETEVYETVDPVTEDLAAELVDDLAQGEDGGPAADLPSPEEIAAVADLPSPEETWAPAEETRASADLPSPEEAAVPGEVVVDEDTVPEGSSSRSGGCAASPARRPGGRAVEFLLVALLALAAWRLLGARRGTGRP